jgi:hypothetical protein
MSAALIEALRAEREGYVQRGLPDRVAEVDAQLKQLGAQPPTPTPPAGVVEEAGGGSARARHGRRKAED